MAQYTIDFSTNASRVTQDLRNLEREIARVANVGSRVRVNLTQTNMGTVAQMERQLGRLEDRAKNIAPNTAAWIQLQQQVARVSSDLQRAQSVAKSIRITESLGAMAPGSLSRLEGQLSLLKTRARDIAPNNQEWRALNKEIRQVELSIEKINRKPLNISQRAGAAGGAFLYGGGLGGGVGSALGGIAGGLAGGVPGAFAGAAIGQLTDNLGQYGAAIATVVSETNKAKIALAGVSNDQQDYTVALQAATEAGQKYLLPLSDSVRQFARLQASVRGAGFDTATTAKAFNGISSAIIATGGNTEDLNSALRATAQVFSKGKVSAEELRQQIGERLPGAFTIFAQSLGKTPQEVDKLLSEGKVGLQEFITFLEELNKRYGTTADILAKAPENAGPRLQVALNALALSYGGFFQRTGAGFQAYAADLANFLLANDKGIKNTISSFTVFAQDLYNIFDRLIKAVTPLFSGFFSYIFDNFARGINALSRLAEESAQVAGTPEQRAQRAVETLYPNPIQRALVGAAAYQEALAVERARDQGSNQRSRTRQQRINELNRSLFGEFVPRSFGTGLGPQGGAVPSAGVDAGKAKGDADRAAEEERRRRERLASQEQQRILALAELRNQLNEIDFEKGKALAEETLNFTRQMIDAEFDYREARANRFSKMQADIERRLAAQRQNVTDALHRYQMSVLETQVQTVAAQAKAAAAAQADAIMPAGTTGGGGAIFGDTGRTSNARGWVHGHFQNMNRQALIQDTADVVTALLQQGVPTELGSGRQFRAGMSRAEIEAIVRQGVASHKKYASGIGAIDVFVPKGTKVPMPLSGVQNLGGAAGYTGGLPRGTQLMHLDPRSRSGATPVSGTAFSIEKREEAARRELQTTQAQSAAELELSKQKLLNSLLKVEAEAKTIIAQAMEKALPVEEQRLENMLSEARLAAQLEGLSDNRVNLLMRQKEATMAANAVQAGFQESVKRAEEQQKTFDQLLRDGKFTQAEHAIATDANSKTIASLKAAIAELNIQLSIYNSEMERAFLATEAARPRLALITALREAKDAIKDLGTPAFQLIEIAQGVSTAFGDAFRGIISGASSAKEVLAGFFKTIGDTFAEMVARMITESVRANILKVGGNILGLLGGPAAAASSGFSPYTAPMLQGVPGGFDPSVYASPMLQGIPSLPSVRPFATGGIVTGPTMGLVGEGRYNEAVVPLPDGKSIPVQLGGGAGSKVSTNIVVNVNNGQAQSQTTGQGGQALARELEGAVRQVILKESRPGGIIYSTNR